MCICVYVCVEVQCERKREREGGMAERERIREGGNVFVCVGVHAYMRCILAVLLLHKI